LCLPLLMFRQGRRTVTLNLILKDVPGTLAKIFNRIYAKNINVVGCITNAIPEESGGILCIVYLDVTDLSTQEFMN